MPDEFYKGTDWQSTSTPDVPLEVHIDDIWPMGDGTEESEKCNPFEGMHPIVAVGSATDRPDNCCGVIVTYDEDTERVRLNIAPGAIVKAYLANVTSYAEGDPATFAASVHVGTPVYVDDSAALGLGCTLSLSPFNDADMLNPRAGFVMPGQTQLPDAAIGGEHTDPFPIEFEADDEVSFLTVHIMLWPNVSEPLRA